MMVSQSIQIHFSRIINRKFISIESYYGGVSVSFAFKVIWLVLLLSAVVGCSGDRIASSVAAQNDSNIKRAVNLYSAYQLTHGYQGPKNEQVLRDFVASHGIPIKNLEMMGVDPSNLDNVFKSERDGKPFKIRYGVTGGMGVSDALVFEDQGVDGKKLVAFNGPVVEDVDDARYKDLLEHGGFPSWMTHKSGRPDAKSGEVKTTAKQ
jgi:hypothetical protein